MEKMFCFQCQETCCNKGCTTRGVCGKAVAVLLALLYLGFRNIRLGPTLPAFLSPAVTEILGSKFGIKVISSPESDIAGMISGK